MAASEQWLKLVLTSFSSASCSGASLDALAPRAVDPVVGLRLSSRLVAAVPVVGFVGMEGFVCVLLTFHFQKILLR